MGKSFSRVVLYDGDCSFCERSISALKRLQSAPGAYVFVPFQQVGEEVMKEYGLTRAACQKAIQLVGNGMQLAGGSAIMEMLASARLPYRLLAIAFRGTIMRAVVNYCYRIIATRRTHISTLLGYRACSISPEDKR